MLKLIINDIPVEVEAGSTVLDAAVKAGVTIPTLCHHPKLHPYGACRLCLVEVEGSPKLWPSCTMPATDNMVIRTESDRLKTARRFVLSMLFSERNHFCMYCQETDGDCDLQQAAYDQDMNHWPITPAYLPYAVDASHPYFVLDNNRCILCRRCARTCTELVGVATLGFEERGTNTFLVADNSVPLGESTCISCGNCVQACPTGALIDRHSMYQGRLTDLDHHPSMCVDCSIGCTRDVLTRDNRLVRIDNIWDESINGGLLCEKGRYTPLLDKRARVEKPLVRVDGVQKAVDWEDALSVAAAQIKAHGSDELSASISSRQGLESQAAFYDLFHNSFQLPKVKLLAADETAGAAVALAEEIGGFESDLTAIDEADAIIVLGADVLDKHQVAGFMVRRQAAMGVDLILANKEDSHLGDIADSLMKYVGEDFAKVIQMLAAARRQDAVEESLQIGQALGVKAHEAQAMLAKVAGWQNPVFVVGKQATTSDPALLKQVVELAKAMNGKVVCLKGGIATLPGALMGYELASPNGSGAKVAFIAIGDAEVCPRAKAEFEAADYRIVASAYQNELTEKAEVVLPTAVWTEVSEHYMASDGRVMENPRAVQPSADVKTTVDLVAALAEKLNTSVSSDWQAFLKKEANPVAMR